MPAERVAGLVAAAGSGTRLGRGPKAFIELAGRSLLARTCAALALHVDELVVAVPPAFEAQAAQEVPAAAVIVGGASRQETVLALLAATTADLVLVHDAARPFLDPEVIRAVVAAARSDGAATVAVKVADTLYDAHRRQTVDRESLWSIQTPQAFRRELLLAAHHQARSQNWAATDDAGLVRRLGREVTLVAGTSQLFKITNAADLTLAEALAGVWDART